MTRGRRGLLGMIALVTTAVALLVLSDLLIRSDLEQSMRQSLEAEGHLVRGLLPLETVRWPSALSKLPPNLTHRITLITPDGTPLADSDPAPSIRTQVPLSNRTEIASAMAGRVGSATRRDAVLGATFLHVAIPGPPIVRVSADLSEINGIVRRAQLGILWAALLALLIGLGLHTLSRRSYRRPLGTLTEAIRALPGGGGLRFARSDIEEIDDLAESLRQMTTRVAEQNQALGAERHHGEALVDTMVEGVLACDARGNVIRANPAIRRLLGYTADEPLPLLATLFHTKAARTLVDAALRGETVTNAELPLDEGALLMSARPLPGGGSVLVLHDVTDIRRLETIRRDFVANVSHELKTPLTSIAGYTETLLRDEVDHPTAIAFLRIIQANARRMQDLIEDQLDLARIESGSFTLHPIQVNLREAGEKAWAGCHEVAEVAQVDFAHHIGSGAETLPVDPASLQQILSNLFSNAIRYSSPGGTVVCTSIAREGGIEIAITDTGSGMTGEHLPRIFERFYRVDPARSRAAGGTGLGLSIVKHLVEAHGGRVAAESALGEGTTIRCWFPTS